MADRDTWKKRVYSGVLAYTSLMTDEQLLPGIAINTLSDTERERVDFAIKAVMEELEKRAEPA